MCEVTANQLKKRKRTLSWSDAVDDDQTSVFCSSRSLADDQLLRQRLVELSLAKVRTAAPLTRSLRRREPPLLRSVLILNTLRAVDATGGILCDVDPTLSVGPATPCRSRSLLDELPGSLLVDDGRALATPCQTNDLTDGEPLTDSRPADDVTSSSILDDLFGCERTSTTTSTSPPILTFSSLFDLDCASVWPSTSVSVSSSSVSSSSSMDVDLDLDVAMFDFDLLQPLATSPAGCAGSRTALCGPAGPGDVGGVLTTSTWTHCCQLFADDLERIAEILVGT